jgi:hypothetical protein
VTTDGEEHSLSTEEPLFVGDVIRSYGEVIERIEPKAKPARIVCRKPRALVKVWLELPPGPFEEALTEEVLVDVDPEHEHAVGDRLDVHGVAWTVRSVSAARLIAERAE